MEAKINLDVTVRTVEIVITDGPELETTREWQRARRRIQVDRVLLKIKPGARMDVTAYGYLIKKDGTPSRNQDSLSWSNYDSYGPRWNDAPDWLMFMATQVLTGEKP